MDLRHDSLTTLIRKIALPASLGMLFSVLLNVVDTFYAGMLSATALAALSLAGPVFFLVFTLVVHPLDTFEFSVTVCVRSKTLFRRHSHPMSRKSNVVCERRQPRLYALQGAKGATEPLQRSVAALDNGTTIAFEQRLALKWLCGSEPECIKWMDH